MSSWFGKRNDSYTSQRLVDIMSLRCKDYPKERNVDEIVPCFDTGSNEFTKVYKHVDRRDKPYKYVAKHPRTDNYETTLEPFVECRLIDGPIDMWSCVTYSSGKL